MAEGRRTTPSLTDAERWELGATFGPCSKQEAEDAADAAMEAIGHGVCVSLTKHVDVPTGSCQGRYASGEFAGMKCIEDAKEIRHGLHLCRRHAKVIDGWLAHGYDYAWSITKLEWRLDLRTGATL